MNRKQSGLLLIGSAILMQALGRSLMTYTRDAHDVVLAGAMALFMFASAVLLLFGLFRLIMGLISRDR